MRIQICMVAMAAVRVWCLCSLFRLSRVLYALYTSISMKGR